MWTPCSFQFQLHASSSATRVITWSCLMCCHGRRSDMPRHGKLRENQQRPVGKTKMYLFTTGNKKQRNKKHQKKYSDATWVKHVENGHRHEHVSGQALLPARRSSHDRDHAHGHEHQPCLARRLDRASALGHPKHRLAWRQAAPRQCNGHAPEHHAHAQLDRLPLFDVRLSANRSLLVLALVTYTNRTMGSIQNEADRL